jgi:DNA-binding NtrC family response regulator
MSPITEGDTMTKRILIVEDDVTLQPFWNTAIRKVDSKTEIVWVTEERAAEKALKESERTGRSFDLIITDLFLEGQRTGIDLFEQCAQDNRTRMLLTSGIHPAKFQRYFGSDVEKAPPFLQKPYSFGECVEVLKWMLGTEGEFGLPHFQSDARSPSQMR